MAKINLANNEFQAINPTYVNLIKSNDYLLNKNKINDSHENELIGLDDFMYSWWVSPVAIRYVGNLDQTYLGYTDRRGYAGVLSINNKTNEVIKARLKKSIVDDHGGVSVAVMPDGRIIAAYSSGHNTDYFIHVRISVNPENIEEFGPDIKINTDSFTTYSQLIYKNKIWWLFFRRADNYWAYSTSTNGVDWNYPITFVDGKEKYYVKVTDTTDKYFLRLVMYSNPNGFDPNMRLALLNTKTRELVKSDGTDMGRAWIQKTEFPIILPVEKEKKQRLLDVAISDPRETIIGYAVFSTPYDAIYKIAYYENGILDRIAVIDAGKSFFLNSYYVGGLVFGENKHTIYLSRYTGTSWQIEKWNIDENIPRAIYSQLIVNANVGVAIRPIFEINGKKVFWLQGFYNENDFTDFHTSLKFREIMK